MMIILFKGIEQKIIENVKHITFTSTKVFVITFSNNTQKNINENEYDFLGIRS